MAIFGLGNQNSYPDTFEDEMGMLVDAVRSTDANLVGFTSVDGYDFNQSLAVDNDQFTRLALDETNQSELTDDRTNAWVFQLISEFEIYLL